MILGYFTTSLAPAWVEKKLSNTNFMFRTPPADFVYQFALEEQSQRISNFKLSITEKRI